MKKKWLALFVLITVNVLGQDIEGQVFPTDDSVIQNMWEAVSYTHLTLPTTPYV